MMTRICSLALATLLALAPPAVAEAPPAPPGASEAPLSAFEEAARRLLQGWLSDLSPALREFEEGLSGLGPLMSDLAKLIGDVQHYQSPERLPNGDILLRRKPGAPPPPPLAPEPPPEGIDL